MRKRLTAFFLGISCFLLTGCGDKLYTLTEDEENTIIAYSSAVVAKYNKKQDQGYIKLIEPKAKEKPDFSNTEDDGNSNPDADNVDDADNKNGSDIADDPQGKGAGSTVQNGQVSTESATLTEAVGTDGMHFDLIDTEVVDAYKISGGAAFVPSSGNAYLIMNIKGTNTTDNDINLDLQSKNFVYKCTLNGSQISGNENSKVNENSETVIENDFSCFVGTVAAKQEMDFVLLFQFPKDKLSDIVDYRLEMTKDGQTLNISL